MIARGEIEYELAGDVNCHYCGKLFPKYFSDPLSWRGYRNERYTEKELQMCLGLRKHWRDIDKDGQWYFYKDRFVCPSCAQKLIESGEVELTTTADEYSTSTVCEDEKEYATPYETDGSFGKYPGFIVSIPYNILTEVRKTRKKKEK